MSLEYWIKELMNSGASKKDIVKGLLELDKSNKDLSVKEAKKRSMLIYKAISKLDKKASELFINNIGR